MRCLQAIGVKSLEDLFKDIPAKHRFPELDLPPALTEMEAAAELAELASRQRERADGPGLLPWRGCI